jgi:acetate kinase
VLAASIGENAPAVRARICEGLQFLGTEIEEERNVTNTNVISTEISRVAVLVIHTDEEAVVAETVCCVLNLPNRKEKEHGQQDEDA